MTDDGTTDEGGAGMDSGDAAVTIRRAEPRDASAWIDLRDALWPDSREDHEGEVPAHLAAPPPREACFVAEAHDGRIVGFAEFRLREYAEDCDTSPVGFVEGIYVEPGSRTSGAGRALVEAGEAWARAAGCTEMASDRLLDNEASGAFHQAIGYEETVRMVAYRKDL